MDLIALLISLFGVLLVYLFTGRLGSSVQRSLVAVAMGFLGLSVAYSLKFPRDPVVAGFNRALVATLTESPSGGYAALLAAFFVLTHAKPDVRGGVVAVGHRGGGKKPWRGRGSAFFVRGPLEEEEEDAHGGVKILRHSNTEEVLVEKDGLPQPRDVEAAAPDPGHHRLLFSTGDGPTVGDPAEGAATAGRGEFRLSTPLGRPAGRSLPEARGAFPVMFCPCQVCQRNIQEVHGLPPRCQSAAAEASSTAESGRSGAKKKSFESGGLSGGGRRGPPGGGAAAEPADLKSCGEISCVPEGLLDLRKLAAANASLLAGSAVVSVVVRSVFGDDPLNIAGFLSGRAGVL